VTDVEQSIKKTKRKKLKTGPIVIIIIVVALVLGYAWWNGKSNDLVPNRSDLGAETAIFSDNKFTILIVGADDNNKVIQDTGRSDTIILATVDVENKDVFLLSIPRDSYVDIEGEGKDKINHAYAAGGMDLLIDTVEKTLNVPVDYYAVTDFDGFKSVIDTLGGIEINVDKRMYFQTYDGLIDIQAGPQLLDGEKALQYVRFRHDPLGDITRVSRQQQFMIAVFKKMMASENYDKLPEVVPKLLSAIDTNMTKSQMLKAALLLKDISNDQISSDTLPGTFYNLNGISYWKLDQEKDQAMITEHFGEQQNEKEQ